MKIIHSLIYTLGLIAIIKDTTAQPMLKLDSLLKNSIANTTIGGYADASYQRDFNIETSTLNINRFVLLVNHQFTNKISLVSELEIEDSKVSGGEEGGEVALEQMYLQFQLSKQHYLVAGLFIPRIGILNEDHLPTSFNGVERNRIETYIIPSTWREIGVGLYGNMQRIPVSYSLGITNGLNSAGFEHGTGIRGGRFEGRNANANCMAVSASVQYNPGNFRFQLSGYSGGSVGLNKHQADSLQLESGFFGTPVMIGEAHAIYSHKGFDLRVLGTVLSIPNANTINAAYANNTPETEVGGYAEIGYNILENSTRMTKQKLIAFARYEYMDLNSTIPANGITDQTLKQQHIVTGLTYLPINNVVVKADVRWMSTGNENPDLVINPSPVAPAYERNNTFLNIGIGLSF